MPPGHALPRSGALLSPGPIAGRAPELPLGSVLALADRRPDPLITIGKWRIIGIPGQPAQSADARHGPCQQGANDTGRPAELRQPAPPLQAVQVQAPAVHDAGDRPGMPAAAQAGDRGAHLLPDPLRQRPMRSESPLATPFPRQRHRAQGRLGRLPAADRFAAVAPAPRTGRAGSAVGWALLSQVFWIPLVGIDLHDRWVAQQRDLTPPGTPLPPSPIAAVTPVRLNDLLSAARPQQLAGQANRVINGAFGEAMRGARSVVGALLSSAGSAASSLLDRPVSVSLETVAPASAARPAPERSGRPPGDAATSLLGRAFTRAQLLGGSIGLADLQEGPMAPLALAERALQRGSGDPLAPLPLLWREPMRQALLRLPGVAPQLSPARTVIVPSRAVRRPVEVPLALQSDGSVDVLEPPRDPGVLREIEGWSRRQRLPATGSLQPALLHLHPLPEAAAGAADADRGTLTLSRSSAGASSSQAAPLSPPHLSAPSTSSVSDTMSTPTATAAPSSSSMPPARSLPAGKGASIPVPILSEAPASSAGGEVAPAAAAP